MKPIEEIEKIYRYMDETIKKCETEKIALKRTYNRLQTPVYQEIAISQNVNIEVVKEKCRQRLEETQERIDALNIQRSQVHETFDMEEEKWVQEGAYYSFNSALFYLMENSKLNGEECLNILTYLVRQDDKVLDIMKSELPASLLSQSEKVNFLNSNLFKPIITKEILEDILEAFEDIGCTGKIKSMLQRVLAKRVRKLEENWECPLREKEKILTFLGQILQEEIEKMAQLEVEIDEVVASSKTVTIDQETYKKQIQNELVELHKKIGNLQIIIEDIKSLFEIEDEQWIQMKIVYRLEETALPTILETCGLDAGEILNVITYINHKNYQTLFSQNETTHTVNYEKVIEHLKKEKCEEENIIQELLKILCMKESSLTIEQQALLEKYHMRFNDYVVKTDLAGVKEYTKILEENFSRDGNYTKEQLDQVAISLKDIGFSPKTIAIIQEQLRKKRPLKKTSATNITTSTPLKKEYLTEEEYSKLLKEVKSYYDTYHRVVKQPMSYEKMAELATYMKKLELNVHAFFTDVLKNKDGKNFIDDKAIDYSIMCEIACIMKEVKFDSTAFLVEAEGYLPKEENPITRYLYTRDRLAHYFPHKVSQIDEYYEMLFDCDDKEYAGWEKEIEDLLIEIEDKIESFKEIQKKMVK